MLLQFKSLLDARTYIYVQISVFLTRFIVIVILFPVLFKLWDIRAGRLLKEFTDHEGPATAVEFHPNEFLLASSSSDSSVNFWDLENFQLVSTTDRDCGAIR